MDKSNFSFENSIQRKKVNWDNSKLFIEFYDPEMSKYPIGLFGSDSLFSDCKVDCQAGIRQFGLNKSLNVLFKHDQDSNLAYIQHTKANLTLYLRKISKGWSFGVKQMDNEIQTSGDCVNGCPITFEINQFKCLADANFKIGEEICKRVFEGMEFYDFDSESIIRSCALDVAVWQDPIVSLDHFWSYVDRVNIQNFTLVEEYRYIKYKFDLDELDSYIGRIKRVKCNNVTPVNNQINELFLNSTQLSKDESKLFCRAETPQKNQTFNIAFPGSNKYYIECNENGWAYLKNVHLKLYSLKSKFVKK